MFQQSWLLVLPLCLVASSVGPGLLVVRRLRLAPLERLVAAVGVSFLLLYAVSFALYAAGAGARWHAVVALAYAGCTAACAGDLRRLWRRRQVRSALLAHVVFLSWSLLLLSFVRHFGGGTWSGDWLEHYQRALFFLEHRPPSTLFLDQYLLPARPPMMNVLAAHFLALTGSGYDKFQLVLLYLNSLVLLACCLVAGNLFPPRRSSATPPPFGRYGLVLLFLAASPFVMQNLTYSWTKLFTAFYVILATHLYLRGLRRRTRIHTVLAFAFLATGCLVHYSAGPYALFVGLHYLYRLARGRARWAEAFAAGVVVAVVLASWIGWSMYTYGAETTFGANSTVSDSAKLSMGGNVRNVARNALNSVVPAVIRNPGLMRDEDLKQPSPEGRARDFSFLVYQVSLPFALGSGGVIVAAYLLARVARGRDRPHGRTDERRFWVGFVVVTFFVGVAVYGGLDRFGVAHVTLQPLVLLGLAALAAGFDRTPRPLRWVLVAGLVLDFALGIVLHFNLQARDLAFVDNGGGQLMVEWNQDTLSRGAQFNWVTKQREGLTFWGDRCAKFLYPMQAGSLFAFGAMMAICLRPYFSRTP